MFGGLHIEKAALSTVGDWLKGSGWTSALVQADVTTPGTADSFLKVPHITCTRRAHQITLASLFILNPPGTKDFGTHTKHQGGGGSKRTPSISRTRNPTNLKPLEGLGVSFKVSKNFKLV